MKATVLTALALLTLSLGCSEDKEPQQSEPATDLSQDRRAIPNDSQDDTATSDSSDSTTGDAGADVASDTSTDTTSDTASDTAPNEDVAPDAEGDAGEQDCAAIFQLETEDGCRPVQVMFIDDGEAPEPEERDGRASTVLIPLLEALQGDESAPSFQVTNVGSLDSWDGSTPNSVDVVFFAQGLDYQTDPSVGQLATISGLSEGGVGLIRTEWGTGYQGIVDDLSPVISPDSDYEEAVMAWRTVDSLSEPYDSVLVALPGTFSLSHGCTDLRAKNAAETGDVAVVVLAELLMTGEEGTQDDHWVPAVSLWPSTEGHGTIIHVNHDLYYSSSSLSEAEIGPLFRAVVWAAASSL
ncbi:MAG: hypothetical protein KC561_12735 [Myxococcales bacterium]|nr:hypothetical protein [Myxococcales bacterium]